MGEKHLSRLNFEKLFFYLFIKLYYLIAMGGHLTHEKIQYSVPVEGSKQKGFSAIYRNPSSLDKLVTTPNPGFTNIKDVIYSTVDRLKSKDFLGQITVKTSNNGGNVTEERELRKFTFEQVYDMSTRVGSFLKNNKMEYTDKAGMKLVGIFSKNRYQWIVADIACTLFGFAVIPLYDTLGIDNLTYCLEHSGITTLFVTEGTIKTILGLKGHGNLENLICFDPLTPEIENELKKHKFKVFHFEDAIKQQKIFDHKSIKVTGSSCLTFSYTSGTTGPPKGAMLSHSNFLSFLAALVAHPAIAGWREDDTYLSFLPLPHVLERVVIISMIHRGCFVAFYGGDILKIKDDMQFVKPTIFVAVPRLFNRIVQSVQKTFSEATGMKACLINNGVQSKLQHLRQTGEFTSTFYDPLVFSKVKQKFGGKVRVMVTGSAPIKKETFEYMKILMSCTFLEGYGQTQSTAAAFITNQIDPRGCHVGGIVTALQFKLADIQEMHYTSEDKDEQGRPTPRGEIWLRGPIVFMGYYKDQQKTEEAITSDGWLKTGDVGQLIPGSNALKIIDRKKNIFKLQQGEYVAAEKVEGAYLKSHLLNQVFLYGEPTHNFAVVIVVPDQKNLMALAEKHSITGSFQEVCKNKNMRVILCKEMDSIGKESGLMSFEQAKNVWIQPESFMLKGIVSSTMKLQRFGAKKYFAKQIQNMYKQGPLTLK